MMRWKCMTGSVLLAGLLVPVLASADALNYTYSEIAAVHMDVDNVDDSTGFRVAASLSVMRDAYLYGDYSRASLDVGERDRTAAIGNLGGGYRLPVSELSDIGLEATWIRTTGPFREDNGSRDGARLSFITRSRVTEWAELGVRAGYTHKGPAGNGYVLGANALLTLFQGVGVNIEALSYDGDVLLVSAGLRFSF